jgi:hypothetical protein
MRQTPDHRERAYAPRGLRREAAADWIGMSPTKFDELVKLGLIPAGKKVCGCRVWDRYLLDIAFENLPDDEDFPSLAPKSAAEAWSGVS